MKGKNNQEETYFLGKAQETRYTKSHIYKKLFCRKVVRCQSSTEMATSTIS